MRLTSNCNKKMDSLRADAAKKSLVWFNYDIDLAEAGWGDIIGNNKGSL